MRGKERRGELMYGGDEREEKRRDERRGGMEEKEEAEMNIEEREYGEEGKIKEE